MADMTQQLWDAWWEKVFKRLPIKVRRSLSIQDWNRTGKAMEYYIVRAAVQAEQEACAKVAEGFTGHQDEDNRKMGLPTQGEAVAAAIRARGKEEG